MLMMVWVVVVVVVSLIPRDGDDDWCGCCFGDRSRPETAWKLKQAMPRADHGGEVHSGTAVPNRTIESASIPSRGAGYLSSDGSCAASNRSVWESLSV